MLLEKKKRILSVLIIVIISIISFFIGIAFNKYNTSIKGEGLAEIATWNFKVNGKSEEIQTIDLASTINNETILGSKLAPGTSGSFDIIIDATETQVGIKYNIISIEEIDKPHNLKFIYEEKEYNSLKELQQKLSGIINANDKNKVRILKILWKWNYETGSTAEEINANNLLDTQDAQNIQNYKFTICVSGEQI